MPRRGPSACRRVHAVYALCWRCCRPERRHFVPASPLGAVVRTLRGFHCFDAARGSGCRRGAWLVLGGSHCFIYYLSGKQQQQRQRFGKHAGPGRRPAACNSNALHRIPYFPVLLHTPAVHGGAVHLLYRDVNNRRFCSPCRAGDRVQGRVALAFFRWRAPWWLMVGPSGPAGRAALHRCWLLMRSHWAPGASGAHLD